MLAGKVIGKVVATRKYPTVEGKKILLVKPMKWQQVRDTLLSGKDEVTDSGKSVVALDSVGAGAGEYVFYVGSREACHAFEDYPVCSFSIVGIIEGISMKGYKQCL